MTEFVVQVPEEQEQFFIELLNKLNFKHRSSESDEVQVPEWHKEIVRQRRKETKREEYIDWNTTMQKLEENA